MLHYANIWEINIKYCEQMLKISVLVDNEPGRGLFGEWGLSIYAEYGKTKILFDADTNPSVLDYNAGKLEIDLSKLDFAVLSHYHYDHTGGFKLVGEVAPSLTVYVPPGPGHELEELGLKPVVVEKTVEVFKGVYVIGPLEAWKDFYEIALAIKLEGKGLVLLVGCSHPGVDKIALKAQKDTGNRVYHVIGGFHGPSKETLDKLAEIATYISASHCSGNSAKNYLSRKYSEKYREVRTGTIIEY
ncbi:MAG: MBL fold metallo-hydrolase [Thermoprotei archaeon]|nr:MAG: MBL fold metallo-hydrolase [Thermoprotei archaeon]RLF00102.1 MAG: MBL fold metallo-hydrolase [Thermoprotei archaeon]